MTFARPGSGLDCLICTIFAQRRLVLKVSSDLEQSGLRGDRGLGWVAQNPRMRVRGSTIGGAALTGSETLVAVREQFEARATTKAGALARSRAWPLRTPDRSEPSSPREVILFACGVSRAKKRGFSVFEGTAVWLRMGGGAPQPPPRPIPS